jgi:malonyl-CoA/methylmalonyl-CoA synthetase
VSDDGFPLQVWRRRIDGASDAPALVTPAGDYSVDDLSGLCDRMAALLLARGLRRGDRVAVQVDKSAEALALYLACLRAGMVYLPLNTGYGAGELRYLLEDAQPAAIVHRAADADPLSALARELGIPLHFSLGARGEGSLPQALTEPPPAGGFPPLEPERTAAILYTSGTTGQPKGAMLSWGNLLSNAQSLVELWGFSAADRLLHVLPLYHVHGLFVACHCALFSGARMRFLDSADAESMIDGLTDCSVMMGVPTHYRRLLASERLNPAACRHMRLFVSGSAPLPERTWAEFETRSGHRILERYGMTETGMTLSNPLLGERRPGAVGLPLPGVEARLRGDDGRLIENSDQVGVLEVRGPNVFQGYWRRPQQTAKEMTGDGYFVTGDLACRDPDGVFRIVGRRKDLIISGGLNVYPKEVEDCLDQMPGIRESAVIGVPDEEFGEAVTAVIVATPEAGIDGRDVKAWARARLTAFKTPRHVHVVDELPRNAMGKVQKQQLRAAYAALLD